VEKHKDYEEELEEISDEIAENFGLPVSSGEVMSLDDRTYQIEFGDIVVKISYPNEPDKSEATALVNAIASFPELLARVGIDRVDANEDFDKLLYTLKVIVDLFVSRTGAESADVSVEESSSDDDSLYKPRRVVQRYSLNNKED